MEKNILRLKIFRMVNGLMDMIFFIKKAKKQKLYLNKNFPHDFRVRKFNNYISKYY